MKAFECSEEACLVECAACGALGRRTASMVEAMRGCVQTGAFNGGGNKRSHPDWGALQRHECGQLVIGGKRTWKEEGVFGGLGRDSGPDSRKSLPCLSPVCRRKRIQTTSWTAVRTTWCGLIWKVCELALKRTLCYKL